jgi:hypothetical protein
MQTTRFVFNLGNPTCDVGGTLVNTRYLRGVFDPIQPKTQS